MSSVSTAEAIADCFTAFDPKNQGYLEKHQVGTVIRALGKNPTQKELDAMLKEIGEDKIDLGKLKLLFRDTKTVKTPAEQDKSMRDAFSALDRDGTGAIPESELRMILGTLGDSLSQQEVNAVLRDAQKNPNGHIDCGQFVDMLVNAYTGDRLK